MRRQWGTIGLGLLFGLALWGAYPFLARDPSGLVCAQAGGCPCDALGPKRVAVIIAEVSHECGVDPRQLNPYKGRLTQDFITNCYYGVPVWGCEGALDLESDKTKQSLKTSLWVVGNCRNYVPR
jgi:hypothetical protein